MDGAGASGIDCADCRQVAKNGENAWPVHIAVGIACVVVLAGLHLKPPEQDVEDESEEAACIGHGPPEDLGLWVVAGGVGDGGVGEGGFLLVLDSHIVGVGGCQQHRGQVEVDDVVDLECPKNVFFRVFDRLELMLLHSYL